MRIAIDREIPERAKVNSPLLIWIPRVSIFHDGGHTLGNAHGIPVRRCIGPATASPTLALKAILSFWVTSSLSNLPVSGSAGSKVL